MITIEKGTFAPETPHPPTTRPRSTLALSLLVISIAAVVGVFIWQALATSGVPDPLAPRTSSSVAVLDIGVLVFREGLECVLVLAAIVAGINASQRKPVAVGAAVGFVATIVTWFIAIAIVGDLTASFPALNVQAVTGLLAVVVLLIVMNWFLHKVYWGGWIAMHNRRKKNLLATQSNESSSGARLLLGLGLLGFTSLYREGFEVVLFLQSYYLKLGARTVLIGAGIGLALSTAVAALTFIGHRRLPHRKMLVVTGALLGVVLLVMVGEQAQEMQLARWIPTTRVELLADKIPQWMGLWFSVFPTVETLSAQFLAAALVIGSYFAAKTQNRAVRQAI
jgi:high-affinity iron transporter